MPLAIKDWDTVFEDRRSREVNALQYLPVSAHRRESTTARLLGQTASGREAYGLFWWCVLIAATCPRPRGVLSDDRGEWTPERIAAKCGWPVGTVRRAIQTLTATEVGWLYVVAPTAQRAVQAPTDCRPSADELPTERRPTADGMPVARVRSRDIRTQNTEEQKTTASSTATHDAAADGVELERLKARAAALMQRPHWLASDLAWLTQEAALKLARLPIDTDMANDVLRETRRSARNLTNPAGYFITTLEKRVAGMNGAHA